MKAKEKTQKQAFSHFSFTESYSLKVALFFLNKETILSFNSSVPFESKNEERIYLRLL